MESCTFIYVINNKRDVLIQYNENYRFDMVFIVFLTILVIRGRNILQNWKLIIMYQLDPGKFLAANENTQASIHITSLILIESTRILVFQVGNLALEVL